MSAYVVCNAQGATARNRAFEEPVHLRWMLPRDVAAMQAIEAECFAAAWTERDFFECLRHPRYVGMVAEQDQRLVGLVLYAVQGSQIRILNLAVPIRDRRYGIATHLVQNLIQKSSLIRQGSIRLVVRETNLAAQLFFRAVGFRAVSILRQFYTESSEDAYLMRYRHGSPDWPSPWKSPARLSATGPSIRTCHWSHGNFDVVERVHPARLSASTSETAEYVDDTVQDTSPSR